MKWRRICEPNMYAYYACLYMTEDGFMFIGFPSGEPDRYILSMSNPPHIITAKVAFYAHLQEIEPPDCQHARFATDEAMMLIAKKSGKQD